MKSMSNGVRSLNNNTDAKMKRLEHTIERIDNDNATHENEND